MSTFTEDLQSLHTELQDRYAEKTTAEQHTAFIKSVGRVADAVYGGQPVQFVIGVQMPDNQVEVMTSLGCWDDAAYAIQSMAERVAQVNPHDVPNEDAPGEVTDDFAQLLGVNENERVYAPHEAPQAVLDAREAVAQLLGISPEELTIVGPDRD